MKKVLKRVSSVLMCICAGLLVVCCTVYAVANTHRSDLDAAFGTSSWTTVTDATGDDNLYNMQAKKEKTVGIDGEEIDVDTSNLKGLFAHEKDVSMRLAAESAVLLKNDNKALPLKTEESRNNITLLGSRSYTVMAEELVWGQKRITPKGTRFGGNMGSVAPGELVVPIADALTANGFTINQTVKTAYETYMAGEGNMIDPVWSNNFRLNESNPTDVKLDSMKSTFGSTAIVTVGRPAGESRYYLPGAAGKADATEFADDKDVLGLSKDELATLAYAKDNFDKVIVLINAVAMDLPELADYADAILWVGIPGVFGFEGIARVLNGTLSPSGSLVDTFAAKSSNSIAMVNQQYSFQSGNGITIDNKTYTNEFYAPEVESIYTGYKYYESRYYDTVVDAGNARDAIGATGGATDWNYANEVVWPFGYGMSYTTFEEDFNVDVNYGTRSVTATVGVKNNGDAAGKHTVQLYASVPYSTDGVEKSAIQLIGFEKTGILKPGDRQTVTITADFQDFASWDDKFKHNAVEGGYVLDAGKYYFALGNGAHDAVNNVLTKQGHTKSASGGYMTADGDAKLVKEIDFNREEITKSKSGEMLQNRLDSMDLEKLVDGVKNFSRADWKNNWPKVYSGLTPAASMKDGLMNQVYTLNENGNPASVKFGQDYGISIADLKPEAGKKLSYDDPILKRFVEQYDLGDAVAQLINGDSYSAGATTVSGKEKAHRIMVLDDGPMGFDKYTAGLGVDIVGQDSPFNASKDPDYDTYKNTAMRTLPCGVNVGATYNKDLTREAGEMMAQLALWNGASGIQGPGSNMHRNTYNSRNHEYYSEDGMHCGLMMDAYCAGAWEYGLICTVKHFAFNDTELNRNGIGAYMSEQRARENELRAFQVGIERKNVVGLMMGMNRAGAYFVGANPGIMAIIRNEWDFTGFIETDMTRGTLDNNRDCLAMGVDSMLHAITSSKCHPEELLKEWKGDNQYATGTVQDIVTKDTYFLTKVQEALMHTTWVMANSNYMNGQNRTTRQVRVNTWYDNMFIALITVTAVLTAAGVAGMITFGILEKKEEKN
jgi:beta-glucosidase